MKNLIALTLIVAATLPALARDSAHLVCSGFMSSTPGPDNYGISVQFDEHRAEDGQSRVELLSSIWAGDLYQGSRLNKEDGFGENGKVTMTAKGDSKKVFFQGKYQIVVDLKNQKYSLKLNGKLNLTPTSESASISEIATTLKCVNISN